MLADSPGREPRPGPAVGVDPAVRLGLRDALERGDRDLHTRQQDHGGLSGAVGLERCRRGASGGVRKLWVRRGVVRGLFWMHKLPCRCAVAVWQCIICLSPIMTDTASTVWFRRYRGREVHFV